VAERLQRVSVWDERLQRMVDQALAASVKEGEGARSPFGPARIWSYLRPGRALAGALTAVLAVALLVIGEPTLNFFGTSEFTQLAAVGEREEFVLPDGSQVHLDVGSEIRYRMTKVKREIAFTRGRAIFEVARDSDRPFSVSTQRGRVIATGTRFQVEEAAYHTVVTLAEGAVTVTPFSKAGREERLVPGEQLSVSTDSGWSKRSVDTQAVTSWASGRHVFRDLALSEAVDEINRYAEVKVRVADPALADLRVSGNFIMGDSELAVSGFVAMLPLRAVPMGDEILLFTQY
jgi:transmembrane sensor